MHFKSLVVLAACLLALTGCRAASFQTKPRPDTESSLAGTEMARVYVFRGGTITGSLRTVEVYDGTQLRGLLRQDDYLCWDKRAERTVFKIIFDQRWTDGPHVESFLDVTFAPGSTNYFMIGIDRQGGKPVIEQVNEATGAEWIAKRKPAKVDPDGEV